MSAKHRPTDVSRARVEAAIAYGAVEEEIARDLGITDRTLRKYYKDEIAKGAYRANLLVGQFLHNMAAGRNGPVVRDKDGSVVRDRDGNPIRDIDYRSCTTAAIFWAKTRMRWTPAVDLNLNSNDDGAAARDQLARALDRLAAQSGAGAAAEQAQA